MHVLKKDFLQGAGQRKLDEEGESVAREGPQEKGVQEVLLPSRELVLNQVNPHSNLCPDLELNCPGVDKLGTGVAPGHPLDFPCQRSHVIHVPVEHRPSSRAS